MVVKTYYDDNTIAYIGVIATIGDFDEINYQNLPFL